MQIISIPRPQDGASAWRSEFFCPDNKLSMLDEAPATWQQVVPAVCSFCNLTKQVVLQHSAPATWLQIVHAAHATWLHVVPAACSHCTLTTNLPAACSSCNLFTICPCSSCNLTTSCPCCMQLLQPDYKLSLLQVALRFPTMEHLVEAGLLTPKGEPNLEPQSLQFKPLAHPCACYLLQAQMQQCISMLLCRTFIRAFICPFDLIWSLDTLYIYWEYDRWQHFVATIVPGADWYQKPEKY